MCLQPEAQASGLPLGFQKKSLWKTVQRIAPKSSYYKEKKKFFLFFLLYLYHRMNVN